MLFLFFKKLDKVMELVGGGSMGPTPYSFKLTRYPNRVNCKER